MKLLLEHTVHSLSRLADAWFFKVFVSATAALFGPFTKAHEALLIVLIADLLTGFLAAAKEKRLSSHTARNKTFAKLAAYFIVLILAYQVEKAITGTVFAFGASFSLSATIIYLVSTEALSVLENVHRLTGVKIKVFNNPTKVLGELKAKDPEESKP